MKQRKRQNETVRSIGLCVSFGGILHHARQAAACLGVFGAILPFRLFAATQTPKALYSASARKTHCTR